MLTLIQGLNTYAGLFSMLIVFFAAFFASKAMSKSTINEAANNAQQRLIDTMKEEIDILKDKMDNAVKENTRLKQTIDTICTALKKKGLFVTIDGDLINIEDGKGGSTIARIQEQHIIS